MVFQLGITRFKGFTQFIKAVKAGKYDQASKEILTTTKKDGTVVKSSFNKQVPARAKRLAAQIKGN
jgi:GH24 family phage-related lysozyme (muramidase)